MFDFLKYNKTHFSAGGLRNPRKSIFGSNRQIVDTRFVAPLRRDNRDICIRTSDQGTSFNCAAYSTAGFIEVTNWKKNHYPSQIDPDPIYIGAKKLDGDDNSGTTLEHAVESALSLNLISGDLQYIENRVNDIKFAIHQYDVFIAGFDITPEWNSVTPTGRISSNNSSVYMGGHAVLVCGYDQEGIYLQNSWGEFWGLYGFGLLSWEQVHDQFCYGLVIV